MIFLIYNFITTIFKSDQKRFSHDRIYVDYSDFRHSAKNRKSSKSSFSSSARRNPNSYKAAREARKIKRTMFGNVMTATISSYNGYMSKALKNVPSPLKQFPKPQSNTQYEKVLSLANQPVPAYQSGLSLFTSGKMEKALEKFSKALDTLDQMDIKHRIDIFSMISECYLRMENSDGYVQYKVKQIRMERKLKTLLQSVFPDKKDSFGKFGWSTTQEASKRLLKIKLMSARVSNPQMKAMLYRAELDLEVARKVSK